jgi:hypothetical protein
VRPLVRAQSRTLIMDRLTETIHGSQLAEPVFVTPDRVHLIWPYVEGMLDKAFRRADLDSIDSTRSDVLTGHALLWIIWDGAKITAALVTKIIKPHDTKICILVACGGEGDWPHLIETIEEYARAEDCAITRIYGRRGWLRVLKDYHVSRVVLDKEL